MGCFSGLSLDRRAPVREEKEAEVVVHIARVEKAWSGLGTMPWR